MGYEVSTCLFPSIGGTMRQQGRLYVALKSLNKTHHKTVLDGRNEMEYFESGIWDEQWHTMRICFAMLDL